MPLAPFYGRMAPRATRCLFVVAFLLLPRLGRAEVYTCSFTEPFVKTVYDARSKTLTLHFDVGKRKRVLTAVSLHAVDGKIIELRGARDELIQRLELSNQGSDGMSDRVFPYEVKWTPNDPDFPEVLYGGCEVSAPRKEAFHPAPRTS